VKQMYGLPISCFEELRQELARESDAAAGKRFVEFLTANVGNPNTRKAYARAAAEFTTWCDQNSCTSCATSSRSMSRPTASLLLDSTWPKGRSVIERNW